MNIVNVIQRYPPALGGSETWCQEVCRYLANRGHKVKVFTLDVNKEEEFWHEPCDDDRLLVMGRLTIDRGVIVRRYRRSIPVPAIYHVLYKWIFDRLLNIHFYGPHSLEMYGKVWREIRKADVVVLHTLPFPHNYFALVFAKCFNKRTVVVPHFHPGHPHYEGWANYWLLRNCDLVIADTEYEKTYFASKNINPEKIITAGVGIHPKQYETKNIDEFKRMLEQQYGVTSSHKIVTFIGRKMPDKGVGTLIEAVRQMYREFPVKLFLVGPSFEWFDEYYAKLSAEDKKSIIDLGTLSHQKKVNLLHLSDMLALPSKFEAFGIVFLEAWICGVPALGTTEGAMPDVIGSEGILTRFGDVADLKEKIMEVFKRPQALHEMGCRGKEKTARLYDWNVIGQKVENCLTN
jgi:glycogen synthase